MSPLAESVKTFTLSPLIAVYGKNFKKSRVLTLYGQKL
jgi:hypothetical protein